MKYIALLRGINVGGNSIVNMSDLKMACKGLGFGNVKTYINSGNIIFESGKQKHEIEEELESTILKMFSVSSKVIVLSIIELEKVVEDAPKEWKDGEDIRKYIAFIKKPGKPEEVLTAVKLTSGVDFIKTGNRVVYMSTLLSGITKSGFTKIIGTPIYKQLTIRNFNTVKKVKSLMEEN